MERNFDDAILPEGFDPDNFNGFTEEPATEAPTEAPVAETDVLTENQTAPEQAAGEQEAQPEETTTSLEQELQATPVPQTIKIKYNHEEREIGLDEAATLAQKGLNYDKLDERIKSFEAVNARNERLARQLGYENASEMIEAAEQNFINREVNKLIEAGNTEAMAKFLVEQQMAKAATQQPVQETKPQEEPTPEPKEAVINSQRRAELDEFVKAYPGITKLPNEVIAANQNGVRLIVAYERFKNKAALEELAILKQNQAAAAKAPVTGVTGKASPDKPEADDPFLKGFDNAY